MFMGINPENPTSFEEIAESVAKAIRGERKFKPEDTCFINIDGKMVSVYEAEPAEFIAWLYKAFPYLAGNLTVDQLYRKDGKKNRSLMLAMAEASLLSKAKIVYKEHPFWLN